MSRRFSQIKKGAEYNTALDNYVTYLRNAETRQTKRLRGGTRGKQRKTVLAAVKPFDKDMGGTGFASTRVSQDTVTAYGSILATRLFTQGTQLANAVKLADFRPARFAAFSGTGAATYVQSKVTKLYYLKYTGDNHTGPFGAISDTEEESTGGSAVKTAILGAMGGADIKRVSISPEKVKV